MGRMNSEIKLLRILIAVVFFASVSRAQLVYPNFQSNNYNVSIPENTAVNTRVLDNIQVNDTTSNSGLIQLSCEPSRTTPSGACSSFSLTAIRQNSFDWNGYMTLTRAVDFDVTPVFNVSLKATDGTRTNYQPVTIYLIDVQNKPPRFIGNVDANVREITSGTTVTVITYNAVDGDTTNQRSIQYSLPGNPGGLFSINPTTGQLTNTKPLTFTDTIWSNGYVTLQVRASEIISPGVVGNDALTTTTVNSRITLFDSNSYTPTFLQPSYAASIVERSPADTPVPGLTIVIEDKDRSPVNSQFDITMDRFTNIFKVAPSNGTGSVSALITVVDSNLINYDTGPREFVFVLTARESKTTERRSSTAQVNITLQGRNDYPPVFNPTSYNVSISELTKGGDPVIQLNATDQDYGYYGVEGIWYRRQSGTGYNLFRVNQNTGLVTVATCPTPGSKNCIDYERNPSYTLYVIAVDNYGEGSTATATINIQLINQNDNVPTFSKQEYISSIKEGTQLLDPTIIINATDDYRNLISFNISAGNGLNIWRIAPNTNELLANRAVYYDDTPSSQGFFLLSLNAANSYGSSSASARITVVPVNNHDPLFDSNYNITISDQTPSGRTVVTIHATDGDSPNTPNGQVRYRLASGTGDNFVVVPVSGVVTVAPGAQLTQPVYNITIVANDLGNPQRTSSGYLLINVTPSTTPPRFQANPLRLSTLESTPVRTDIGSSNVVSTNANPVLVYDIIDPISAFVGNGIAVQLNNTDRTMFAVNATTGMIYVNQPLKYDHINVWQAVLRVIDQSVPASAASSAMATVIVTVYSVNSKPPVFNFPWTPQNPMINISRSQDAEPNTPVATLTATSPNSTLNINYTLIDDYNGVFTINPNTGQVRINRTLSYANDTNVKFVVVATDDGQPSLSSTATVYLTVQNSNQYAPQFTETSYYTEIPENSPGGTYVTTVKATDRDTGDFGQVRYTISSPNNEFKIDPVTGVITVNDGAILDRETRPEIFVTVNAVDSPNDLSQQNSVSAEVLVNLTDVNDNAPKFDRPIYIPALITADVGLDYNIIQVLATDPDLGDNGTVRYSITDGNDNNLFKIDQVTGIVTPASSLLNSPGAHDITVTASDLGTPDRRNSTVHVIITVQQAARLPPVWYQPAADNTTLYIDEGLPAGTYLTTVYANSSTGGPVKYQLLYLEAHVDQSSDFRINSTTGVITTVQPFIYEVQNVYLLRLVAINQFGDSANRYINVNINKVDNVNPKFPTNNNTCCATSYYFTVDKVSPVNSVFGVVKATLPNPYRAIFYRTLPLAGDGGQYFGVVSSTGQIIVNGSLDGVLANSTYQLLVEAYHMQVHPFGNIVPPCMCNNASRVYVFINVVDNTQRVPIFKSRYDECISENTEIGSSVFQANNTNYAPDRPVDYSMQSLQSLGTVVKNYDILRDKLPFIMPPPNGTVFTNEAMKSYLASYFTLVVNATFVGRSKRFDSAVFNVMLWVVQLKDEILITIDKPVNEVEDNLDQYKQWIASKINRGVVCIKDVRAHISQAGAVNDRQTDLLLWVIDGNSNQVVPPLVLDGMFTIDDRKAYSIIGITKLYDYWDGFNYIPVAAAIGIIIGLLVLALILFLCCCCCWSWLLKSARYTEKEPLIYNAGSLGVVNPVWNQKMFEAQQLSMAVNEGDGMDKTIALHGAYNGYDAGDGDVFGDGTSRLNLHSGGSQSGLSTGTQPGLVHIEAPLSEGYGGATASTHRETEMTVESALHAAPAPALTAAAAPSGGTSSDMNGMSYSGMPLNQTTTETTTTRTQMVRGYSTGTMTDVGDDDDGAAGGTVTRPIHSSYDAPVVELTGARDRPSGPSKIGATLYQPFGITGEQRPQSVISGRETYMNEEDYRGTMAGGYTDDRMGARSAMSSLPLQKEIVFSDLRPESMYGAGGDYGYENAGGYQRDSDGGAYQGEIRLGTMREPLGSSSDRVHETRYL